MSQSNYERQQDFMPEKKPPTIEVEELDSDKASYMVFPYDSRDTFEIKLILIEGD